MKSSKDIKKDLLSIRYYNSRQEIFDSVAKKVGQNSIVNLANKYNECMQSAPPRLYDLYISLYVLNSTQERFAIESNYSLQNVQFHHKNLIEYLKQEFVSD